MPTSPVMVGALDEGAPVGMLVGSFTAVSRDPGLVGFLAAQSSATLPRLLAAERLGFCLLHESEGHVVDAFAGTTGSPFDSFEWEIDHQFQVPVLRAAPLVVFGRAVGSAEMGDRVFVSVEVEDTRTTGTPKPFVLCGGRVARIDPGQVMDSEAWQLSWSE